MPSISFRASNDFLDKILCRHAFFASWGRVPRYSKVDFRGNVFTVFPDMKGTGTVHLPVLDERLGLSLFSTETLLQRTKPYLLAKELGRGELGRLLRDLYEWKLYGFLPPPEMQREVRESARRFARMATSEEHAKETELEAEHLVFSLRELATRVAEEYIDQVIKTRQSHQEHLPVSLGVFANIGGGIQPFLEQEPLRSVFRDAFQTVATTPTWREIEPQPRTYRWDIVEQRLDFIESLGMQNLIGPIISFDPTTFPLWLRNMVNNGNDFEKAALGYIREFATRFRQRSRLWVLANNFFSAPSCGFSIGRGVSMICDLAYELKRLVPSEVVIVGIDQPWGDYYRETESLLPFAAIAESLASVGAIDGFLLELNLGLEKGNTLPRDPNLLGRLIDIWSLTEKQMFVSLSVPSRKTIDPFPRNATSGSAFEWNEDHQSEWILRSIMMSLTKRNVHGFFWNQLIDPNLRDPDKLPAHIGRLSSFYFAGLLSEYGEMKPALHDLAAFRRKYLI